MPTLNPEKLEDHYLKNNPLEDLSIGRRTHRTRTAEPQPKMTAAELYRGIRKTLLIGSAVVAFAYGTTELAHFLGNEEHAPWQHPQPGHIHK